MFSESECMKILNQGEVKYNIEEVKTIRDLLVSLATIEFDQFNELKRTDKV